MRNFILIILIFSGLFAVDAGYEIESMQKKQTMPREYDYEKLIKDMIYRLDRINSDLKYVKDEKTAKRVVTSIKRNFTQFNSLNKKMANMPAPSLEIQEKLRKKYDADFTASASEFTSLIAELATKEYAAELMQVIQSE